MSVESSPQGYHGKVRLRMLGPLVIERAGVPLELPASRKTRGLLAYLALASRPVSRARLCALLWDEAANDPRGELRWCISKLRSLLSNSGGSRNIVVTSGDTVALRLDGWFVDAAEVASAFEGGIETLGAGQLQALCELYTGELLEGLVIERCPEFNLWLTGQLWRGSTEPRLSILSRSKERGGKCAKRSKRRIRRPASRPICWRHPRLAQVSKPFQKRCVAHHWP